MIIARFELDEERGSLTLRVSGHAGAAKAGEDIVCASASILAYTLAQTMKVDRTAGRLRYEPRIKLHDGDAVVTVRPTSEWTGAVLAEWFVVLNGYLLLAHNYPQYVTVDTEKFVKMEEETA